MTTTTEDSETFVNIHLHPRAYYDNLITNENEDESATTTEIDPIKKKVNHEGELHTKDLEGHYHNQTTSTVVEGHDDAVGENDPILGKTKDNGMLYTNPKKCDSFEPTSSSSSTTLRRASEGDDKDVVRHQTKGVNINGEYDRYDMPLKRPRFPLSHLFSVAVCALDIIGLIGFILLVVWLTQYHDGFAWDGSKREFNYHAVFMFLGLIFFYANGTLKYVRLAI